MGGTKQKKRQKKKIRSHTKKSTTAGEEETGKTAGCEHEVLHWSKQTSEEMKKGGGKNHHTKDRENREEKVNQSQITRPHTSH